MKVSQIISSLVLVRIKIFAIRDLWLFLAGILFVSATSGAIGAFILGVTNEEFLIGEADDILIVSQPGATTPLTGMVPENLKDDIQKITGVKAISPETLTFSVAQNLNDKSILVRGITPNFTKLTSTTLIDGVWFDPFFGNAEEVHTDGVMVGYLLAAGFGLNCGDKLILASTLTDMIIEVIITGIIRTNSPSDEELLISLSLGKSIAGKEPTFVSFLRVLIDNTFISKEALFDILNAEYTIPIILRTEDPKLAPNLVGIPVSAYSSQGAYVDTQRIREGNRTEFNLKFGTYEFIASPSGVQNSPALTVFVNQSFKQPFEIVVGESYYDLQLNITHNEEPAENALTTIQEKFGERRTYFSNTNEDGMSYFHSIAKNIYIVDVSYKTINKSLTIGVSNSTQENIKLESSLSLKIYNVSTGLEIQGGTVRILNQSTMDEVVRKDSYKSGTPIFVKPGEYKIEFQYNTFLKNIFMVINDSIQEAINIGFAPLDIWVRGENSQGLDSANVSITQDNDPITEFNTHSDGTYEVQLEVDLYYNITVHPIDNETWIQSRMFNFRGSTSIIIDFLETYKMEVVVVNGTAGELFDNVLTDCDVKIFSGLTLIDSSKTNSSGMVTFDLSEVGMYRVTAEKDGFSNEKTVPIYNASTTQFIPLGDVRLFVSTRTVSEFPISGIEVSLINETGISASGITNSSGLVELVFPIGNYTIRLIKGTFDWQNDILFYESQSTKFPMIVEYSGDLTINLINQFSQKMNQAYIEIINNHYNISHIGFTDANGEVSFYKIPWGNWSTYITYYDEVFPRIVVEFAEGELSLHLQVESSQIIFDSDVYTWASTKSFSVILSANYVSDFLQTTLDIIFTTFTTLVVIISVLSLLSIASVISQPIVSNSKTLGTFKQLGASKNQVTFGVVVHLCLLGIIASTIGSLMGMWIMTIIPDLKNVNIGGMIIRPRINFWIIFTIAVSSFGVIILKSTQKVRQLYKLHSY
ncbi:MAG: FtsX-like permease family protein [Candidatus Hodarchaeota archaeon]